MLFPLTPTNVPPALRLTSTVNTPHFIRKSHQFNYAAYVVSCTVSGMTNGDSHSSSACFSTTWCDATHIARICLTLIFPLRVCLFFLLLFFALDHYPLCICSVNFFSVMVLSEVRHKQIVSVVTSNVTTELTQHAMYHHQIHLEWLESSLETFVGTDNHHRYWRKSELIINYLVMMIVLFHDLYQHHHPAYDAIIILLHL